MLQPMRGAFLLSFAFLVGASGCDSSQSQPPPETYTAPPPIHPAMREPATAPPQSRPERTEATSGDGDLPAGHPAIAPPADSRATAPAPASASPGLVEKLAPFGVELKVPEGWKEVASSSSMRLATFDLARAEGDAQDAEVSVIPAKGSEDSNIDRWRKQFKENPEAVTSKREASGIRITVSEMEGTYTGGGSMGGGSPAEQQGTKLWGAILRVPGSQELIFFKAWGPKATMEKWKASFGELLDSIQPKS